MAFEDIEVWLEKSRCVIKKTPSIPLFSEVSWVMKLAPTQPLPVCRISLLPQAHHCAHGGGALDGEKWGEAWWAVAQRVSDGWAAGELMDSSVGLS